MIELQVSDLDLVALDLHTRSFQLKVDCILFLLLRGLRSPGQRHKHPKSLGNEAVDC